MHCLFLIWVLQTQHAKLTHALPHHQSYFHNISSSSTKRASWHFAFNHVLLMVNWWTILLVISPFKCSLSSPILPWGSCELSNCMSYSCMILIDQPGKFIECPSYVHDLPLNALEIINYLVTPLFGPWCTSTNLCCQTLCVKKTFSLKKTDLHLIVITVIHSKHQSSVSPLNQLITLEVCILLPLTHTLYDVGFGLDFPQNKYMYKIIFHLICLIGFPVSSFRICKKICVLGHMYVKI